MNQFVNQFDPDRVEFVARIIGAIGQLLSDFHDRDLAVQNALSDMTHSPGSAKLNMTDLQHIDLVTQTHDDLARLLSKLSQNIRAGDITEHSLAGTLTLRSLQDTLLRPPLNDDRDTSKRDELDPGEMDLF